MRLAIYLIVGGLMALPASALAQTGTSTSNRGMIATDNARARSMIYEDNRRRISGDRRSEERQERADRLSAMASNGQCRQAVAIARREGDNEMARSLVRHCGLPTRLD